MLTIWAKEKKHIFLRKTTVATYWKLWEKLGCDFQSVRMRRLTVQVKSPVSLFQECLCTSVNNFAKCDAVSYAACIIVPLASVQLFGLRKKTHIFKKNNSSYLLETLRKIRLWFPIGSNAQINCAGQVSSFIISRMFMHKRKQFRKVWCC